MPTKKKTTTTTTKKKNYTGISISARKAKGRRLQQWACKQISELLGLPWGYEEAIRPALMGESGVDVKLVGEAKKRFPFAIECFGESTLILTKEGYKKIKDVEVGDKVLTHKGRFRKVKDVFSRITNESLLLKAKHLNEKIHCTKNHPFESFSNDWIDADSISHVSHFCKTNDVYNYDIKRLEIWDKNKLAKNKEIDQDHILCACGCNTKIKKYDKKGRPVRYLKGHQGSIPKNRDIPKAVVVDKSLLYLFGFYIAEGHIDKKRTRVVWTFNKNEIDYINDVKSICKKKFNIDIKTTQTNDSEAINLIANSSILAKFFIKILGTGSKNKKIGAFIFLHKKRLIPLIRGYFYGDGCIRSDFARCETVSRNLAYEIQFCLLKFGIFSSITKAKNKIDNHNDLYSVLISKSSLNRFLFILENDNIKDCPDINTSENYDIVYDLKRQRIFSQIEKKESVEAKTRVYNLTVEEDETYIVEGSIVVHNCKNCEQWGVAKFIEQAKDNQSEETDWLVIMKKNNHEEVVVIDAKVFFNLLKKLKP